MHVYTNKVCFFVSAKTEKKEVAIAAIAISNSLLDYQFLDLPPQ